MNYFPKLVPHGQSLAYLYIFHSSSQNFLLSYQLEFVMAGVNVTFNNLQSGQQTT